MAYEYAVKFVCGSTNSGILARGSYFTAINVHNPSDRDIEISKRFALAGEKPEYPGPISETFVVGLGRDQVLEIDCRDIFEHTSSITSAPFRTGFAIIQSDVELDVVSVYTAEGLFGRVKTLHIEPIRARETQSIPPRGLDHFKVYEVSTVEIEAEVGLTTNFDPEPIPVRIENLSFFANPTRKLHDGSWVEIQNVNAHFTWYTFDQERHEPGGTVRFRNQLGTGSIDLDHPKFLMVPAEKTSDQDSKFPENLDHFKCYSVAQINTLSPPPIVTLADQFGIEEEVQIGKPIFYCVPVRKERRGERPGEIMNASDRLVFYELPRKPINRKISIRDQFGARPLEVARSLWLGVPTEALIEPA